MARLNSVEKPRRRWWWWPGAYRQLPLLVAIVLAGLLARWRPGTWSAPGRALADARGVTVLIPERGTPDLLAETLEAAMQAVAMLDEPAQVLVVVNGAAAERYAALGKRWPTVEWQFHANALGYNGAIVAGLAAARHAWTYLLNSDMRLDPTALVELMPYRHEHVFAITSQIFFNDAGRRREETGWSDFHWNPSVPEVYERTPDGGRLARGNLYPGGGSSLCRTGPLRRYAADSRDYSPFYWEDADWGVRAWSDGWEVLFCPTSRAWHEHRGTIKRFHVAAEVDRVIARNALLFDLRHGWTSLGPSALMQRIVEADPATRRELDGVGLAWRVLRSRLASRRARRRGLDFARLAVDRYHAPRLPSPARKPRVLLVSPFALFPPSHGGGRRVAELVARLADDVDFILLGDERSRYTPSAEPWLAHFVLSHLVEGRGDAIDDAPLGMNARMHRHAWPLLRRELDRMIAVHDPDIVQVEFMELALLADQRHGRARWLLALHDVALGGRAEDAANDREQRAAIARFDGVTVCSGEDAAMLGDPHTHLIGNGATDRRAKYEPSAQAAHVLFMGPFRYPQNLAGIQEFIDVAWTALRNRFPDATLTILGGDHAADIARDDARFARPGIRVVDGFVDPEPFLHACTLTINPQRDIRGSSIKLIESLLAGRVCVTTRDGARGFLDDRFDGIEACDGIGAMLDPLVRMLADPALRHARERADDRRLDAYTWDAMAARQRVLYAQLRERALPEEPESTR